jgi:hypothetical protein
MDRLNSQFLLPSTRSRGVSGDVHSALFVKLGVSPSRSCLQTQVLRGQSHPITATSLQSTNLLRLWTAATSGHIVHPPDDMSLKSDGGKILTGKTQRTGRRTCHSTTLSTTNPTWIDQSANLDLRCERQVTNRLSHGTAYPCLNSSL